MNLPLLAIASRGIILSRQWTTKVLIRLHGCAGWSAPLFFTYGINRFSHNVAHIAFKEWFYCRPWGKRNSLDYQQWRSAILFQLQWGLHSLSGLLCSSVCRTHGGNNTSKIKVSPVVHHLDVPCCGVARGSQDARASIKLWKTLVLKAILRYPFL